MGPSGWLLALLLAAPGAARREPAAGCLAGPDAGREALALHRHWRAASAWAGARGAAADVDVASVAVLEDRGDLVARRNPFDLDAASVRFTPDPRGGYRLARLALPLSPPADPLAVGSGPAEVALPFAFPFFGQRHGRAFVHADGHVTFGDPDPAPVGSGVLRFLAGPPRVAAFFADLAPSEGSVSARVAPQQASFVWSNVPGAGQANRNSFEIVLHADGGIDLAWGDMGSREAVVGLSPGGASEATPADLSAAQPTAVDGAVLERFSESEQVDLVSVARRFYAGHPDLFQQLVVYTTRPLNPAPGTLAFELGLRNEVAGIGLDRFDFGAEWGSPERLESVVYMDAVDAYLELDGFEILGHEVGHRWLAFLGFRDRATGQRSDALLGRGRSHWSFFLDTDASLLEGNDIEERGGGRFETLDIARRFSPLDQYAMGLREASEVPPFFYVDQADDFRPARVFKVSSAPEPGVSFSGVRREVRIEDVIAALGPRVPDAARAPRALRQAWLLVAVPEAPATPERLGALARIRARFEAFFREATDGRGSVDTSLP